MSVMLALGLALSSLGYKQETLASTAIESQYAFYASDAALECALYADQRQNLFDYASHNAGSLPATYLFSCNGVSITSSSYSYNATRLVVTERFPVGTTRCADVTVYKYATPQPLITYIFSQGYDVPCTSITPGARFVSRGIGFHY